MLRWKQKFALLCVGLLLCVLSGCANTSPKVDELLRAPILSASYSNIQAALETQFNENVQLKYPTEGELLSPFSFGDWNGDGVNEAVVLFTVEQSSTVLVGVLYQDEAGAWQLAGVASGVSDTVLTVEFASMQENAGQQVVVSFQAQGEKYLAVYAYQDGWLSTVFQQPYSQYLVEDITGTGTDDLILITNDDAGILQMELLTFGAEGFTQMLVPTFNKVPFTSYANITTSVTLSGRQYLLIDGFVGEGKTTLASEIIWYNTVADVFEETALLGTQNLYDDSKRYNANLISCDIGQDGAVEIPVPYGASEDGILNHVQGRPVSLIAWMDFTQLDSQQSFGLYDDEYKYYLALPEELKGNLLLVDGGIDNTVEVRNLAGDVLYFAVRVVDFDVHNTDWVQIGSVASKQIQVKIGDDIGAFLSASILSRSIYLL